MQPLSNTFFANQRNNGIEIWITPRLFLHPPTGCAFTMLIPRTMRILVARAFLCLEGAIKCTSCWTRLWCVVKQALDEAITLSEASSDWLWPCNAPKTIPRFDVACSCSTACLVNLAAFSITLIDTTHFVSLKWTLPIEKSCRTMLCILKCTWLATHDLLPDATSGPIQIDVHIIERCGTMRKVGFCAGNLRPFTTIIGCASLFVGL